MTQSEVKPKTVLITGATDAVARNFPRLDVLVNDAGIGSGARDTGRQVSIDGFELRFAVNYLAGN